LAVGPEIVGTASGRRFSRDEGFNPCPQSIPCEKWPLVGFVGKMKNLQAQRWCDPEAGFVLKPIKQGHDRGDEA
jgi:hypothetical protein